MPHNALVARSARSGRQCRHEAAVQRQHATVRFRTRQQYEHVRCAFRGRSDGAVEPPGGAVMLCRSGHAARSDPARARPRQPRHSRVRCGEQLLLRGCRARCAPQPAAFRLWLTARSRSGNSPTDLALRLMDVVHSTTGWPWWMTVAGITLGIRCFLLPLGLYGVRCFPPCHRGHARLFDAAAPRRRPPATLFVPNGAHDAGVEEGAGGDEGRPAGQDRARADEDVSKADEGGRRRRWAPLAAAA